MDSLKTQSPDFTIRFTTKQDIPLILQFIKDLAQYEHMEQDVVATEELLDEFLFEKRTAECVIAEQQGAPVGFALFFHNFSTFLGRPGIYLEDLYVKPEMRGRGYGKIILSFLANVARERRCGRMEWACLNWNEPSRGFYKHLGAQPIEDWTTFRLTGEALSALADTF